MTKAKERIGPGDLGIDLSKGNDSQTFKWLIASLLFSAPIDQEMGAAAFRALDKDRILTPKKLAELTSSTSSTCWGKATTVATTSRPRRS